MGRFTVDVVIVSPVVNAKINQRHRLSTLDVEEAIENRTAARTDHNEEGSERLLLVGRTASGRQIRVVLYATEQPGTWRLATAFPRPDTEGVQYSGHAR